jgi:GNAT superfamily N-acetyltransferase
VIRGASLDDVDELLRLGRQMHAESEMPYAFNAGKLRGLIERMLVQPHLGIVLVAERDGAIIGFMGGMVAPHFFSDAMVATDFALYVEPEHRGGMTGASLIKAFEKRAFQLGAWECCPGVSVDINAEQAVELYERLGYKRKSVGLSKCATRH